MATPGISLASESENGGTTKGDGAREFISTHGPLLAFNPIMAFFHELWHNYQGARIENL
jgi:hypothetical protein